MLKKSFFFVRTPLHYLNALEAKEFYCIDSKDAILVVMADYWPTINQLKEIINNEFWSEIKFIWADIREKKKGVLHYFLSTPLRCYRFYKTIKQVDKASYVFWGNYNSVWLKYLYAKKKGLDNLFILDDGFATINIMYKDLSNQGRSMVGRFEHYLLGAPPNIEFENLLFFSNYFFRNTIQIVNHNYSNISKILNVREKKIKKSVYFIGQPLVHLDIIDGAEYCYCVKKIVEYYENFGLEFFYISHRTEKKKYVPKNCNVLELDTPIEYKYLTSNVIPMVFATFFSSACYNLNMILKGYNIEFHYWKNNNLLSSHRIKRIYSYLESTNQKGQKVYLCSDTNATKVDFKKNSNFED